MVVSGILFGGVHPTVVVLTLDNVALSVIRITALSLCFVISGIDL